MDPKHGPPDQIGVRNWKPFFFISTQTYVVGTQKNRLNETVLLSTLNNGLNWWISKKPNFTSKKLLNWTYAKHSLIKGLYCNLEILFIRFYLIPYLHLYFFVPYFYYAFYQLGLTRTETVIPWVKVQNFQNPDFLKVYS